MQRQLLSISLGHGYALPLLIAAPSASAEDEIDIRFRNFSQCIREDYDGVDWNGDGVIGSISDQFIELNAGNQPVDVSNWWLDDNEDGGSAACQLAWNTTIPADGRIVVFRSDRY